MSVEFYNVKTRSKVNIDEDKVQKVVLQTRNGDRYALRSEYDGTKLTKFISKDTYETLNVEKA